MRLVLLISSFCLFHKKLTLNDFTPKLSQLNPKMYSFPADKAAQLISRALESIRPNQRVQLSTASSQKLVLRIQPKVGVDRVKLKSMIDQIATTELNGIESVSSFGMKKPAIFIRKIRHCKKVTQKLILNYFSPKLSQFNPKMYPIHRDQWRVS